MMPSHLVGRRFSVHGMQDTHKKKDTKTDRQERDDDDGDNDDNGAS